MVGVAKTAVANEAGDTATEGRTVCSKTGFALVPASGQAAYRIAKTSYGALNPPQRDTSADRSRWGRWDVSRHRTVYAGSPKACAYAESLATFRPAIDLQLAELFDDEREDRTLEQEVRHEWAGRNHMKLGSLPQGWREERNIYQLTLPQTGWFVDIEAAESISAIFKSHGEVLAAAGVEQLSTSHLHGEDRTLTTNIAQRVHESVLFDGSLPQGIWYSSKHGRSWDCWAVWLRAVDDGKALGAEPTRLIAAIEIKKSHLNASLRTVLDLFDLTCH